MVFQCFVVPLFSFSRYPNTWRIIPVRKWLMTMVNKSRMVVPLPNGFFIAYTWRLLTTYKSWDDPPSITQILTDGNPEHFGTVRLLECFFSSKKSSRKCIFRIYPPPSKFCRDSLPKIAIIMVVTGVLGGG